MKTVSGLSSEHLRFDVGAFIPQLRDAPKASNEGDHFATHPSSLIRCRALLWFSLNDFCIRGDDHLNKEQFTKLDKRIENNLNLFVDGPTKRLIEDAKEDLAIWISGQNVTKTANQARQFPINKQIGKN
ncbi:MAG: hypothetical protein O3A85_14725 [Proteobacteria bacterium]|nr:hypothetical protein [Pseudomonadota bacterium]